MSRPIALQLWHSLKKTSAPKRLGLEMPPEPPRIRFGRVTFPCANARNGPEATPAIRPVN
jgi:hypothetical protein